MLREEDYSRPLQWMVGKIENIDLFDSRLVVSCLSYVHCIGRGVDGGINEERYKGARLFIIMKKKESL